jgi:hypothetical protein
VMAERKPDGYWKDLATTVSEAKRVMGIHQWGKLPNGKRLVKEGYVSLSYAIDTHHGGMRRFRDALGEDVGQDPKELRNERVIVKVVERIAAENGLDHFPTSTELDDLGHSALRANIVRHHGGVYELSRKTSLKPLSRKYGGWKDRDYVVGEALAFMREEGFEELPSFKVLHGRGYCSLGSSISRYHGGFPAFREVLRGEMGAPSAGEEIEGILREYVSGGGD